MIVWKRDDCGRTVSSCGRFKIDPKYWGCVRPSSYELRVDGKYVCSPNLLRDAKLAAENLVERQS